MLLILKATELDILYLSLKYFHEGWLLTNLLVTTDFSVYEPKAVRTLLLDLGLVTHLEHNCSL